VNSVVTSESYCTCYIKWYVQRLFTRSWSFKTLLYFVTLHTTSELPPTCA